MAVPDLFTPCLLLDVDKLAANIARMNARLDGTGVAFRPHFKTAKCLEVADLIAAGQPPRFTVSTLAEAAALAAHGVRDLLYAVGIAPGKLDAVAALRRSGADLTIVLDSVAAARAVSAHSTAHGVRHRVMIEVDTDGHRAGLQPDDPELSSVAAALTGCELVGVMTHAGDSYLGRSEDAIRDYARREASGAVHAAQRLRAAGHLCLEVSVGSSPTVRFLEARPGVTEVRAGVFAFGDLFMAGLGVCAIEDIALSCLVTVIGHQPSRNWILTDGGWTALSQDRSTSSLPVDRHYGMACDADGNIIDDLYVLKANQEHGIIGRPDGGAVPNIPYGTRLRVLPNHACAMANQHTSFHVQGSGAIWRRIIGWAPEATDAHAFAERHP